jgi:hypothetical protein
VTGRGRTRWGSGLLAALAAGLLAGCVNVPTVGPVERVEGSAQGCQNCVDIQVAPPAPGDEPKQIVDGYLRATSNYQANYAVARQFLTADAGERWSPEDGALIYRGLPKAGGVDQVTFDGRLLGSLAADRTYTARDEPLRHDFGLRRENGEWRIDNPPPGLMVSDFSFTSSYQAYDLFFVGSSGGSYSTLVPDPIYLPRLNSTASVASALMKALLNGPSQWLQPAVSTRIPQGTTLNVDSVTITGDGVATVPLSDQVLALSDPDRSLLAAQVVYTLKQVVGIKGVMFTVNQQSYRVPGSDPNSQTVATKDFAAELDPIPSVAADQLYAVKGRSLELVTVNASETTLAPAPGPLGRGELDLESIAVSVTNTDVAVVTGRRTRLARAPASNADGSVATLLQGVEELVRPQFSRYGEIWDVGRRGKRQQMWMFGPDPVQVDAAEVLAGGTVRAFRISPDGTRMALVRRAGNRDELGLARIIRTGASTVTVDGWRVLNTTQENQPQVTQMADVGWLNATQLLVLGSANKNAALGPVKITADASQISGENQANNWNAVELTVQPRTQTALIVGKDRRIYRDDGGQWQPFLDGVTTIAYPG